MSLLPSAADCASSPEHHQFRQRRHGPDLPGCLAVADRFHQFGPNEERQALVAADMVVGAGVFVAGMADQHRSRHQFAELAAAMQAETALAHIGDRVTAMLLRERPVAGPRAAAKVGHGNGFALDERGRDHPANLVMAPRRRNGQQHVEQRPGATQADTTVASSANSSLRLSMVSGAGPVCSLLVRNQENAPRSGMRTVAASYSGLTSLMTCRSRRSR